MSESGFLRIPWFWRLGPWNLSVGSDIIERMFGLVAERQVLPDDLESIAPGPFLAAILSAVDRSRLNGHDAVRVMRPTPVFKPILRLRRCL